MPKAILEFTLPEEYHEHLQATLAPTAFQAIDNILDLYRNMLKHQEPDKLFKTPTDAVEHLQQKTLDILSKHNIFHALD